MSCLTQLSFVANLFFVAVFLSIILQGRKWIKKLFFKYIIDLRHQQRLSMFKASPMFKDAIVFVGDSITEGGNWSELFPNHHILNRGIGGDVSEGVLKRVDEIIRHRPIKIFICIGTNDLAKEVPQNTIIGNYKKIVETLEMQLPQAKIYVQSVLPVGKNVIAGHDNKKIALLNKEIEKLCKDKQLTYIDLYSNFTDSSGYLNPSYTNDKLHLMGEGYLLWKKLIEAYL